ncbi:MAG: hypothetical protein Q4E89_04105 [Eubacteriales bacterium]|nr:hypothetical protein [Eubacteriales bacterium]
MRVQSLLAGIAIALTVCLALSCQGEEKSSGSFIGPMKREEPEVSSEPVVLEPEEKEEPVQDAMIARPENYEEPSFYNQLIFIGDSRTVGMCDAVQESTDVTTIWSCKIAMGYDWMVSTGVPQIEQYVGEDTAVIFLMGVNDPGNIQSYISYVNDKADEWDALGADTYYAAVGPVSKETRYVSGQDIADFNMSLQEGLLDVTYLDVYGYLVENGYSTTDGLHYTASTYQDIYQYIVEHLENDSGGVEGSIW